ncbi:hypothetical protein GQ44DRAFT_811349 [Phaeosphaeriaceae sp. PMI808]|nr:hypothetical protein GQ44DRAFT_811349 [Phaeosphaeriaceae sp. PMI808]
MCGISCLVTLCGHKPLFGDREKLGQAIDQSLDTIKHRGPDSGRHWINESGRVAEQPFHDTDNNVHAVVNGELYGYQEIREELTAKGYRFKSKCDSEIVVYLYKEYGLSFLSNLRGEFSLCLYDSKSQLFVAASDRYAIKPIYYTIHNGNLLAKAFLPLGWKPQWDVQSIKDVGWLCDQRTFFKGVNSINPGHYLVVKSFDTISQQKYWDIAFQCKNDIETRTEKEMIQGVQDRLVEAVRDRLRADVPVGVFLSGGIDSSSIAGIVTHLMRTEGIQLGTAPPSEAINCFSVKFIGEEHDEEPIARRTAEWLGVKMHYIEMTEETFVANIEDAVWHNEIAWKDLSTVGKFMLSKLTRDAGIKVVLTGEGSDEHFGGYKELLKDFVREPDHSWKESSLTEEERLKTIKELEGRLSYHTKDPPVAVRRQVNNISSLDFTEYCALDDGLLSPWVATEFGESDRRLTAVNALDGCTRELINKKWHPFHTALYIWTKCTLAKLFLTVLGDRCEMAHSVEGRQPFLDHRLTEYVMSLPPSMKIRWDPETQTFSEKWILKEAVKPFVTEELYNRKKHPFTAPIKYKAGGAVYNLFNTLITNENIEAVGFLKWDKCEGLVQRAIEEGNRRAFGMMIFVGQLVILQKKFGIEKAHPF